MVNVAAHRTARPLSPILNFPLPPHTTLHLESNEHRAL